MKRTHSVFPLIFGIILLAGAGGLLLLFSNYEVSLNPFGITAPFVAELHGELGLTGSCVTIMDDHKKQFTLIWPSYFEVLINDGRVTIFDYYRT